MEKDNNSMVVSGDYKTWFKSQRNAKIANATKKKLDEIDLHINAFYLEIGKLYIMLDRGKISKEEFDREFKVYKISIKKLEDTIASLIE